MSELGKERGKEPRVSVALCTYNGARWLPEQLASLAAQTRLPHELVVCDDRSTDETEAVVRAFAATAPFPVRFQVNERNLGSTANFERAIGMCTGELIALCDQDDVWPAHKLARIVPEFQRHPGVALVFTDGMVVDERLRPTGARLWESFGITPRMVRRVARGEAFPLLTGRNLVTGAAMVFRADLVPLALPVPEDTARIHDGWIALVAAAAAEVVMIGEPLLLYRRHESQQVGPGSPAEWNPGLLERLFRSLRAQPGSYLGEIQALEATRGSLAGRWSGFAESRAARQLDGKIANLRARAALPRGLLRRLPVVLRELTALRYHRFAEGMWSAARDLVGGS